MQVHKADVIARAKKHAVKRTILFISLSTSSSFSGLDAISKVRERKNEDVETELKDGPARHTKLRELGLASFGIIPSDSQHSDSGRQLSIVVRHRFRQHYTTWDLEVCDSINARI